VASPAGGHEREANRGGRGGEGGHEVGGQAEAAGRREREHARPVLRDERGLDLVLRPASTDHAPDEDALALRLRGVGEASGAPQTRHMTSFSTSGRVVFGHPVAASAVIAPATILRPAGRGGPFARHEPTSHGARHSRVPRSAAGQLGIEMLDQVGVDLEERDGAAEAGGHDPV
jgi:hypothetical protein